MKNAVPCDGVFYGRGCDLATQSEPEEKREETGQGGKKRLRHKEYTEKGSPKTTKNLFDQKTHKKLSKRAILRLIRGFKHKNQPKQGVSIELSAFFKNQFHTRPEPLGHNEDQDFSSVLQFHTQDAR